MSAAKLNPSEAQRKAMVDYAVEFEPKLKGGAGYLVDGMVEAANSIPEGAPVCTIARRPDGEWVAVRRYSELWKENHWIYVYVGAAPTEDHPLPALSDADSWPVIYDPDEYQERDKPRLERLMREPSVFDLDRLTMDWIRNPTARQEPASGEATQ